LSKIPCKIFILDDGCQSLFDCFCLLFDKLNCVSQEDNFFACSIFAQVVVHGTDGNSCLACTSGKVDDAVPVQWILKKSGLEVPQTDFHHFILRLWLFLDYLFIEKFLIFILELELDVFLFVFFSLVFNLHFILFIIWVIDAQIRYVRSLAFFTFILQYLHLLFIKAYVIKGIIVSFLPLCFLDRDRRLGNHRHLMNWLVRRLIHACNSRSILWSVSKSLWGWNIFLLAKRSGIHIYYNCLSN